MEGVGEREEGARYRKRMNVRTGRSMEGKKRLIEEKSKR